jgi:hypothetical protein
MRAGGKHRPAFFLNTERIFHHETAISQSHASRDTRLFGCWSADFASLRLGFDGIELWLSVVSGAGLILYSLMTDYRFGFAKLLSYNLHLLFDVTAGVALFAAPFILGFGFTATIYYPIMAIGVFAVVAASERMSALRA